MCLGATARSTHRGDNLGRLVKNGSEAHEARLRVTLSNAGVCTCVSGSGVCMCVRACFACVCMCVCVFTSLYSPRCRTSPLGRLSDWWGRGRGKGHGMVSAGEPHPTVGVCACVCVCVPVWLCA
jgi:hypothetical protein